VASRRAGVTPSVLVTERSGHRDRVGRSRRVVRARVGGSAGAVMVADCSGCRSPTRRVAQVTGMVTVLPTGRFRESAMCGDGGGCRGAPARRWSR